MNYFKSIVLVVVCSVACLHASHMSRSEQEKLIRERQNNARFRSLAITPEAQARATQLLQAINAGNVENVKKILEDDMDVKLFINMKNKNGETPLMYAMQMMHDRLKDAKRSAEFKMRSEMVSALSKGSREMPEAVIVTWTPEMQKVWQKYMDIIKELIDARADLNMQDAQGNTILMQAVYSHNLPIVEQLLHANADRNIQNNVGNTALIIAVNNGHHDLVELLPAKTDLNVKNMLGETALLSAAQLWDVTSVKILLDAGADLNATDNQGYTPLIYAADCGEDIRKAQDKAEDRLAIVKMLLAKGADVTKKDTEGATALMYAQACEDAALVKALKDAESPKVEAATTPKKAWISPSARRRQEEAAAKARAVSTSPFSLSTSPLGLETIAEEKGTNQ